ncbi:MAG: porin [Prolixibacteraceae bacterium]|nr:porin [Prolixibacteraceae bacterium]
MKKLMVLFFIAILFSLENAVAQNKLDIGFWSQAWYQHVENGKNGNALNDFMVRRAYLSVKGQPTDYLGFFAHVAVDRLGQDGLDNPSQGLGSGLAFRDLWITLSLNESFKIQAGRMYVPLTRNYGTTSTKSLLTTDLSFMQGGIRGGIFYTSKVGRDDGVTLWGNPFDGRLQYRMMVSEGVEDAGNPEDKLRVVGRLVVNLLEPEKEWFNQGTYLGKKKVLSFGAGIDNQKNLTLNNITGQDNMIWTVDGFFDHPVAKDAITVESAYIHIQNSTQTNTFAKLIPGDNADLFYLQAGYYFGAPIFKGNLQPYFRYENVSIEQKNETNFLSGGINYYMKGHNAKLSLDYTVINHSEIDDQSMFTLQLAIGI